jgi:hypothetical protein
MNGMALAFRLARRELRSGLSGFRIFFASLVLGVVAIASVGSLSQAFIAGLAQQGRVLLGGDVSVGLVHREATPAEHVFLSHYGGVSENISMRAMAYAQTQNEDRELIELKAVDGLYPLYGSVGLTPATPMQSALSCSKDICGALAEQTLLDRLHLARGGIMRVGNAKFRVAAVLTSEPDRISGGFSLGPHVMISREGLTRTGLVTLGSLIEYSYRVAAHGNFSAAAFKQAALKAFPDAGWEIHDRSDAAPGTKSLIEELTMFLTLVGLTVLAVGGVGAGQAISAFLDRKRGEIAILKSLGADGRLIFFTFFMQIMAIAALAVIVGLVIGAAIPFAIGWAYETRLPMPAIFALYPGPLALDAGARPRNRTRKPVPRSYCAQQRARTPALSAGRRVRGIACHRAHADTFALACFRDGVSGGHRRRPHRSARDCGRFAFYRTAFAASARAGFTACTRQHDAARCGNARRGDGAGPRPHAARDSYAARPHDLRAGGKRSAGKRTQLLFHRHSACSVETLRSDRDALQIGRGLSQHADDPWTDYSAERHARARCEDRQKRALGVERRSRHHLRGDTAEEHGDDGRQMVGRRL